MNFLFFHLPALLASGLILVASVLPISDSALVGHISDKTLHLFAYFVLSFLIARSFSRIGGSFFTQRFVLFAWISTALYGLCVELIQSQIPYRSFEVLDLAANAFGALLGTVLYVKLSKLKSLNKIL